MNLYNICGFILFQAKCSHSINFPGARTAVSEPKPFIPEPSSSGSEFDFERSSTFAEASCSADGTTPTTVTLANGEGRLFKSPSYPSNYPEGQSCTYNFEPAAGTELVFSCTTVFLVATSAVGDLCTGDYLRFYDTTGSLGTSGTR